MQWNVKREASDDLNRKEQDIQREHTIPRAHVATWLCCDDVALQPLLPQLLVANDHTVLKREMRNILAQFSHQYKCRGKHEGNAASILNPESS